MRNTLSDLNNYLFEQMERLSDDSMTEEQLQKEIVRSKAIQGVAQTIVNNATLALNTMKQIYEQGDKMPLPPVLGGDEGAKKALQGVQGGSAG